MTSLPMPVPLQFTDLAKVRLPSGPVHLAIGMFDGVHLGHRATIQPAIKAARASNGMAVVLTFWPHPSSLFRPSDPTRLIQSPATKAVVLGSLGVDAIVTLPFTSEFAQLPAEVFLPWLKRHLPMLAAVYVGENFRYGCRRQGDAGSLCASGASLGLDVHVAAPMAVAGEGVSSTRIRTLLLAGEIAQANALLGYPYFSDGVVSTGKRLGRTIGVPTLNLSWSPDLKPRFGVYAVRVRGSKSASALPGVANYGLRPTVENTHEPKLEVHVLSDCPYDAGDHLTVDWLHFIRPEQKFSDLDALRAQIARDAESARAQLAERP